MSGGDQRIEGQRCPRCESTSIAKVLPSAGLWQLGHHYCRDCNHQAYWGEFCDPPARIVTVGGEMDTEAAVVLDRDERPIYWHRPEGCSAVAIPDSWELWEVLWNSREQLGGVAHVHPHVTGPAPSHEDVTTFAAVEAAIGRRLLWWIVTPHELACVEWSGNRLDYDIWVLSSLCEEPAWVRELRRFACSSRATVALNGPPSE